MGIKVTEIVLIIFALLALLFTIVAMAVQNWLYYYSYTHNKLSHRNEVGPYKTCTTDYFRRTTFCQSNRRGWRHNKDYVFMEATAAFLTIGFILVLVATILIFLFIFLRKLKTKIVKIVIIVLGFIAAICLLISFAIWIGSWEQRYHLKDKFGPGPWLDIVACILTFIMAGLSIILSASTTASVN